MSTKYGQPAPTWNTAKEEMRKILIAQVRKGETISYSELVDVVQAIRLSRILTL